MKKFDEVNVPISELAQRHRDRVMQKRQEIEKIITDIFENELSGRLTTGEIGWVCKKVSISINE